MATTATPHPNPAPVATIPLYLNSPAASTSISSTSNPARRSLQLGATNPASPRSSLLGPSSPSTSSSDTVKRSSVAGPPVPPKPPAMLAAASQNPATAPAARARSKTVDQPGQARASPTGDGYGYGPGVAVVQNVNEFGANQPAVPPRSTAAQPSTRLAGPRDFYHPVVAARAFPSSAHAASTSAEFSSYATIRPPPPSVSSSSSDYHTVVTASPFPSSSSSSLPVIPPRTRTSSTPLPHLYPSRDVLAPPPARLGPNIPSSSNNHIPLSSNGTQNPSFLSATNKFATTATSQTVKLSSRIAAGAGLLGKEWGRKGKGLLEDRLKMARRNSGGAGGGTSSFGTSSGSSWSNSGGGSGGNLSHSQPPSISSPIGVDTNTGVGFSRHDSRSPPPPSSSQAPRPGHGYHTSISSLSLSDPHRAASPAPLGTSENPIRLPATILGVRVPKMSGVVFGRPLEEVVEKTRVRDFDGLHRRKDLDEVKGDEARKWMPGIVFRCLQYLEEWGKKEEGIYRVPGSSYQIAQLRALFDAGLDLDLREIHPGDLDPHAVASFFKSWLRELPESILSNALEGAVDVLVKESTGYSAIAAHFLGQKTTPVAPGGGMVDGRAPRELLEKLRELFGGGMPAEEYYLLRAVAYHLARLASHSATNKMTLSNLRLILSPTLRLSPVMLAILVEDREILFSKPNDSARLREASIDQNTFSSHSPTLSTGGADRSPTLAYSPKVSPQGSPLLNPPSPRLLPGYISSETGLGISTGTGSSSNVSLGSWHVVDSPTGSSFTPTSSGPARTPIADRFASSSASNSPTSPVFLQPTPSPTFIPSPASSFQPSPQLPSPQTATKQFIPSRSNGGTFFTNRDPVLSNQSGPKRKGSKVESEDDAVSPVSVVEVVGPPVVERSRKMTLQEAMAEQRQRQVSPSSSKFDMPTPPLPQQEQRKSPEKLRQWSDEEEDSEGDLYPRQVSLVRTEFGDSPQRGGGSSGRPSLDTLSSGSGRDSRASKRLSVFFGNATVIKDLPSRKTSPPPPTLELPVGLGLGLQGDGGEGESWGLLSFEERKKFFGG
ncbi:hypothetical protein T439DRAFT_320948 [Meredithblackwellia eburnea MCA 4105]